MVLFPGDCRRLPRYPLKKLPPTAIVFIGSLSILIGQGESLVWSSWGVSTPPEDDDDDVYPPPLNITLLVGEDAGREWFDASDVRSEERRRSPATPKPWSSSECMAQWGMAELQRKPDPRGYLVFTEGREQLGNNRFLLSDGLVIAKALNRTLVEFPMANSRIVTPHAELGFCDYWDCSVMCSYHRILDLETFRSFLREGFLTVDGFVSVVSADWEQRLLPALETAEDINDFFFMCRDYKVIELRMAWKSGLRREPMALFTPNPFYLELVGRLITEQKGWENGRFLAVQWRTETSRGNLSECYTRYVAPAIEDFLHFLDLGRDQVFFNVDLIGQASTTYNASVVRSNQIVLEKFQADYPVGMDNTVYDFLKEEQDAGVKAMITGLVSASSGYLLSSSFNASTSNICQKPHSKYIDLVAEWRLGLLGKDPLSMGELFPVFDEPPTFTLPLTLVIFAASLVLCVMMWAAQARARERLKSS